MSDFSASAVAFFLTLFSARVILRFLRALASATFLMERAPMLFNLSRACAMRSSGSSTPYSAGALKRRSSSRNHCGSPLSAKVCRLYPPSSSLRRFSAVSSICPRTIASACLSMAACELSFFRASRSSSSSSSESHWAKRPPTCFAASNSMSSKMPVSGTPPSSTSGSVLPCRTRFATDSAALTASDVASAPGCAADALAFRARLRWLLVSTCGCASASFTSTDSDVEATFTATAGAGALTACAAPLPACLPSPLPACLPSPLPACLPSTLPA
mmetsp:Transcript_26482/g.55654  ORF Transcript_26482/g.55654 Transcript_26482/m.55654 type:complete len:273 (+) Transcript_26482:1066-1884(+)